MKLVICGLGKYFKKFEDEIDYFNVIALIDNNAIMQGQIIHGFQVQSYEVLRSLEFNYIIVFSNLYRNEMIQTLYDDYGISKLKIIVWYDFLKYYEISKSISTEGLMELSMKLIRAYKFVSILDVGMLLADNSILNREDSRVNLSNNVILDCYNYKHNKVYPFLFNLYSHIHTEGINDKYDLAAIMYVKNISLAECEKIIEETYSLSRYIMINITDCENNPKELWQWLMYDYEKWGHVSRLYTDTMRIVLIDKEYRNYNLDLSIFVVTHKKFSPPKNNIYIPIQAGRELNDDLGYLSDNIGDNISTLNPFINECTALYWVWKHTNSTYVGINHYRRYFLKNEIAYFDNIINEETINSIMKNYDFILPCSNHDYPGSIREGMLDGVNNEAVEKGISLVRNIIVMRHTDYLEAFDHVFEGNTFYMCNMFITKRNIFNIYCEWFFDIIIEAAKKMDVSQYDPYSKRIIGFIAERMLTVWLLKTSYKIKELPIIITE